MKIYLVDGSLELLYCAVFEYFDTKERDAVSIVQENLFQPSFIDEVTYIGYDQNKFERIKKGIEKKLDKTWQQNIIYSYLSEKPEVHQHIFNFLIYVFKNDEPVYQNFGHPDVIALAQITKSVSRERHRMKAFIRFEKSQDGVFFQKINPDFNVLPLIVSHFKNRYADQKWIIFDEKRNYGFMYDTFKVEIIHQDVFTDLNLENNNEVSALVFDKDEALYQQLWKDYFKSTNIVSRKNTKLHLQHVPRRYWKYLTEKF